MSIRLISTEQLRRMGDQEGLVLQGCGGDPQEWLDGINEILAQECILKKGAGFEEAYTFRRDGLTCMLFPFKENIELDVGWESLLYGGWHPIPPSAEHGYLISCSMLSKRSSSKNSLREISSPSQSFCRETTPGF